MVKADRQQIIRAPVPARKHFVSAWNYRYAVVADRLLRVTVRIAGPLLRPSRRGAHPNRVVVLSPTHIGDMLISTPAIRFLKQKRPDWEILWLASRSSRAVAAANPYVDRILELSLPWFEGERSGMLTGVKGFFRLVRLLRREAPWAVVNLNPSSYHREHLAGWLAGIPERVGYAHKGFGCLLTVPVSSIPQQPMPYQELHLVSAWLAEDASGFSLRPDFAISEEVRRTAQRRLAALGLSEVRPWIAFSPGARHPFIWPAAHWVTLANLVRRNLEAEIVFLGTEEWADEIDKLRSQLPFTTYSLVGHTSIAELVAVLERMHALVAVDTGTRHLANVAGTSTIVLRHAADSPGKYGRYVHSEIVLTHPVPCSPCGRPYCPLETVECMSGISPHRVFRELHGLLQRSDSGRTDRPD